MSARVRIDFNSVMRDRTVAALRSAASQPLLVGESVHVYDDDGLTGTAVVTALYGSLAWLRLAAVYDEEDTP